MLPGAGESRMMNTESPDCSRSSSASCGKSILLLVVFHNYISSDNTRAHTFLRAHNTTTTSIRRTMYRNGADDALVPSQTHSWPLNWAGQLQRSISRCWCDSRTHSITGWRPPLGTAASDSAVKKKKTLLYDNTLPIIITGCCVRIVQSFCCLPNRENIETCLLHEI